MKRPKWGGAYAARLVRATLDQYGPQCHLCRDPAPATTADHIIPRSRDGPDTLANLRPAHKRCNQRRGNRTLAEWFEENPLYRSTPTLPPSRDW